jgi:hypothetical protein
MARLLPAMFGLVGQDTQKALGIELTPGSAHRIRDQ